MAVSELASPRPRWRGLFLVAALVASLVVPAGSVVATDSQRSAPDPPDFDPAPSTSSFEPHSSIPGAIDRDDRDAVTEAFRWDYLWKVDLVPIVRQAPFDWTGSATGCQAGDISAATRRRALDSINFFRAMTGVQPVVFSSEYDHKAQEAALIMHANNSLSHSPSPGWKCYTDDGAEGAANSNLSIGTTHVRSSIEGYMWDPGAHNTEVGHRRWFLSPGSEVQGFGATSNTTAGWVVHSNWDYQDGPEWMAYPTDGYWPKWLATTRWSISHDDWTTDFSGAQVTMSHRGKALGITVHSPGFSNYGFVSTLVWDVTDNTFWDILDDFDDAVFDIKVTGIVVDGNTVSRAYSVVMYNPLPPVLGDIANSTFGRDITYIQWNDVTRGCNPPRNDRFCPDDFVTRGQMAAFLVRALELTESGSASFTDTEGSTFETDINRLAHADITRGCNPPQNTRFCPDDFVTRGQMAAFLVRALELTERSVTFTDTDGSVFEADIERLAHAEITRGCNPPQNTRFCPGDRVTRGQMAAFLARTLVHLGK